MGTPTFMAPELALGAALDGRADIYALGCVAYWLLTGALVFEADTLVGLLAKHLQEEPVAPSQRTHLEIPADLEAVVMACPRKDPGERPHSADDLARRLSGCEVGTWTRADAERWWQLARPRRAPPPRRSPSTRSDDRPLRLGRGREVQVDGRAPPGPSLHAHPAAVGFGHLTHHGEAQPGSPLLGAVEGEQRLAHHRLRHAPTAVEDGEL